MRAKNREINIFNMSLLDILTGMLGAFLFLMLGLVPYYSKALHGVVITQEDKEKLDKLKDLLNKGLKGPLSPEEAEMLRQELDRLTNENQQLSASNQQLKQDFDKARQEADEATKEKTFWVGQSASLNLLVAWDSAEADIDVFILEPDGTLAGPKKEKLLGKDTFKAGVDSHGIGTDKQPYKSTVEVTSITMDNAGDYLVFYRVPPNAPPAGYAGLYGTWVSRELQYDPTASNSGFVSTSGAGLGDAKAALAKPGGLYAWAILNYDPQKKVATWKAVTGKLPPGVQIPQ